MPGKLAIGVDSNQNGIQPGSVLTSMVKRVDVAVYNAFTDAQGGKFTPGFNVLGLKEGGVDYAMDDNNKALVTDEMIAAVEKAKADIIAGTIKVHDYMSDRPAPIEFSLIAEFETARSVTGRFCFDGSRFRVDRIVYCGDHRPWMSEPFPTRGMTARSARC